VRLRDRLANLLGADRPEHLRLILVLDALDEAAEFIEPWAKRLGQGVYTLVTCRAEIADEPRVLRAWRERATENGMPVVEHTLRPLDGEAIAEWLSAAIGRTVALTDSMVASAQRASEGVPLFAAYLIPDALASLQVGAADPFPATFNDYARRQLDELRNGLIGAPIGRWTWGNVLDLFAVLSVAKAPLLPAALRGLTGGERLDELDQRAKRWMSRRADADGAVSLVHPRLASVFGIVLAEPDFDVDAVEIEQRLVEACARAWGRARDPLRAYALVWLPAHLIGLNRIEETAELLSDAAFLVARLASDPTVAAVHATASETIRLDLQLAGGHSAVATWRRFWVGTEARLANGIERAASLGLIATELFAQLVEDVFEPQELASLRLPEALPKRSSRGPRLTRACGFSHPALLRSADSAHQGEVSGVLVLGDVLVSWGRDGAIRFWSRAGEPRPGGPAAAHQGGVWGVLALGDRLVSWGGDGAIRFWSYAGEPRPGGDPAAHQGSVEGALALGNRLVNWSLEGSIRFFNPAGEPLASRDPGGVWGVLALGDGLVSWGGDGAIRFWSRTGEPRPGGDPAAHRGGVQGMLALDDGLVSWGGEGAIRFWSQAGEPRPGGDPAAHQGVVWGVLALDDRLVSWGGDGAIRFWSRAGDLGPYRRPAMDQDFISGMLAFGDSLVSWGEEGGIRFWSQGVNRR
jgi:hypothetical protein